MNSAMLSEKLLMMGVSSSEVAKSATSSMARTVKDKTVIFLGMKPDERESVEIETDEIKTKNEKEKEERRKMMKRVFLGGAVLTMTFSFLAMIIEASGICVITFFLTMFVAPYAVFQKHQLLKNETVRELVDKMRFEGKMLREENSKLTQYVITMGAQVKHLRTIENRLGSITDRQGHSVNAFVQVLKENKKILAAMNERAKSQVLEIIVGIVLTADRDDNFIIDETEINMLVMRMCNNPSLKVDGEVLRNALRAKAGGRVGSFVNFTKELLEAKNTSEFGIHLS